jgi:hypothetical protein
MDNSGPEVKQRQDGSLWLSVDGKNPLSTVVTEVEVVRERQRWMTAPDFSRNHYRAKPTQKKIGLLHAIIILVRESMRPRDEVAERLRDIEELILAGHNDAAERHIDRFKADYPTEEMKALVLGLVSLNLYDQGNEVKARYVHEFALLSSTAHPVMTEIFGDTIPERWED